MGTWGFNILQDDAALDVHSEYMERYNAGWLHDRILADMIAGNAEMLGDDDEAPVFWLAVARAQWDCGTLSAEVLKRVEQIIERGEGLERWEDTGLGSAARRRKVVTAFLGKLRSPNARPKKPRKGVLRKPVFVAGDCLAIRLSDGDYAAAIVLALPPELPRPGADTYGLNLIGLLRYKSPAKPTQDHFERREWLRLTHHSWNNALAVFHTSALGFRSAKERIEVVGKTRIRSDDPKDSRMFSGLDLAEGVISQATWDGGIK